MAFFQTPAPAKSGLVQLATVTAAAGLIDFNGTYFSSRYSGYIIRGFVNLAAGTDALGMRLNNDSSGGNYYSTIVQTTTDLLVGTSAVAPSTSGAAFGTIGNSPMWDIQVDIGDWDATNEKTMYMVQRSHGNTGLHIQLCAAGWVSAAHITRVTLFSENQTLQGQATIYGMLAN